MPSENCSHFSTSGPLSKPDDLELPLITFDDSLSVHFNGEEIKVNGALPCNR